MLLAYFGPETMMPMTSVLAAVAGLFLMLGRQSLVFVRLALRKLGRMVGLVKAPAPTSRTAPPRGARLDPAAPAVHGSHTIEQPAPKASEFGEAR
jgi:hypothetical protein